MSRRITAWHARLLAVSCLFAASCGSPAPQPPLAEGVRIDFEGGDAPLVFEPPVLALGRVVPGGIVDGLARVRNSSPRPVEILSFSAPCECTSAQPELPRILAPGESFSFPVRLSLGRLPRGGLSLEDLDEVEELHRGLTFWTADGRSVELPVVAVLSEELLVEPVVTDFRAVLQGESATATVVVGPGRGRPDASVRVLSVSAASGSVPLAVEQRPTEVGVELDLSLGPLTETGRLEAEVLVLTDAEPEPVRLLFKTDVLAPLFVVPDSIQVPAASPNQPIALELLVRRRDGGPLVLTEATSDSGRIKLELTGAGPNGTRGVRVLIGVPAWPTEVEASITLQTDFPGEAGRLTVPVFVQARAPR